MCYSQWVEFVLFHSSSGFWTISHHMIFGLRLHMHWPSGSFQICGLLARYHATRLWLFLCRRFPITTLSTSQSNIILIIEMSFGKSIIIGKKQLFFVMCIFFSFKFVCKYSGWTLVILFIHELVYSINTFFFSAVRHLPIFQIEINLYLLLILFLRS